jgi:hypothetical protein
MIEGIVGKVPLPGINIRDRHKITGIKDQKPAIDPGVQGEIKNPRPQGE